MATERISFLARADDDDCKLGDSVINSIIDDLQALGLVG